MRTCLPILGVAFALLSVTAASAQTPVFRRAVSRPLPGHPGNIFLAGEEIEVAAPGVRSGRWRVTDYDGATVAAGETGDGQVRMGKLPVGYYELQCDAEVSNRVTVGVLAPLLAPTPWTSPIGIDVAMAWFFPTQAMAGPANLCALAGMNRVRDRLLWPELEPRRGQFLPWTRYDESIRVQRDAGLKVLEVNHASPQWANPNPKRFPLDLRDVYQFYRELARRWAGGVEAFEPWNEADIAMFGGHIGSEMASLQKAAYVGLKAGNPAVRACLNVFAIRRPATLGDFAANQAWPYFDTFNLHHYEPLQNYPELYADFRAVSAGKPLWVTECSVRVRWSGDERLKELSEENLRLQSERVTKTFALALFQGAAAVFYFMLPHYSEGAVQFGLLHSDLSPRPGYVALAAVGRLLADAKPLGRMPLADKAGQAYFFSAKPDGQPAAVAVAWAQQEVGFQLPAEPLACYDHLGRRHAVSGRSASVGRQALFFVFSNEVPAGLIPPPPPAKKLSGQPSPVVLQALLPESDIALEQSAYRIKPGEAKAVPVFIYNFGEHRASGRLAASGPERWQVKLTDQAVEVMPGERKSLTLEVSPPGKDTWKEAVVRLDGDFGADGRPVLYLRFVPDGSAPGKQAPLNSKSTASK